MSQPVMKTLARILPASENPALGLSLEPLGLDFHLLQQAR